MVCLGGGLLGDFLGSSLIRVKSELQQDRQRASRLRRRAMLVVGILLSVTNMMPNHLPFAPNPYWSDSNRVLLAVGIALIVLAVVTKPKYEPL